MSNATAARRYAKALFALSREKELTEQVRTDLDALVSLMNTSPEWRGVILAPLGSLANREKALHTVLDGRVHELTLRFLLFIDRKRRITLLALIQQEWMALYDEAMGIRRARVVTASPLNNDQVDRLAERLSSRFGAKVILTPGLDAGLIGGLRLHIGDQVLDYSIEAQLQQLKKRMIHA